MNMRKTGILAAALLVLGLSACGSDDDAFQSGSGPAGSAKVASVTVVTDTPTIASSGHTGRQRAQPMQRSSSIHAMTGGLVTP